MDPPKTAREGAQGARQQKRARGPAMVSTIGKDSMDNNEADGSQVGGERTPEAGVNGRSGSQQHLTQYFEARKSRPRAPLARKPEKSSIQEVEDDVPAKPVEHSASTAETEDEAEHVAGEASASSSRGTGPAKDAKGSSSDDKDKEIVELLHFMSSVQTVGEDADSAAARNADVTASKTARPDAPTGDAGPPDQKDWAWEKSCHDGLLTFHDGRKRW